MRGQFDPQSCGYALKVLLVAGDDRVAPSRGPDYNGGIDHIGSARQRTRPACGTSDQLAEGLDATV